MSQVRVEDVVSALNEAGIPALAAYPGSASPEVEAAVAAVSIAGADSQKQTLSILVRVYCPASAGGQVCGQKALAVGAVLEGLGAAWKCGGCESTQKGRLLVTEVTGIFSGEAAGWTPAEIGITVKLGTITLNHVTNFTAWQELDPDLGDALSDMGWIFRIEEWHPGGIAEEGSPNEPFKITVTRPGMTEAYANCVWTSHERRDDIDGLWLIRTGTASVRSFIGVI